MTMWKKEWWFVIFLEYFLVNTSGSEGKQPFHIITKPMNWDAVVMEDLQNKAICLGFSGGEGRNTSEVCKKVTFSKN